ncbi:MAG: hypothetical protein AAGF12_21775 [Myxococcota bacterium]
MSTSEDEPESVSPVDVRLRVISIALEPALTLARIVALPLDDLQRLVTAGYFREARSRGMSFRTIARRFDKSLRTVTNLSKTAAEAVPLSTSQRITWRRKLAELVVRLGPLDEEALFQKLPSAPRQDLEEQLQQLVDEGIVIKTDDTVHAAAEHMDLVRDELDARLDSLRHFLGSVAQVAYQRFFATDEGSEAFARVLTFQASREHLHAIRERAYASMRSDVFEADEAATKSGDGIDATLVFSVVEASRDPAWRPPKR